MRCLNKAQTGARLRATAKPLAAKPAVSRTRVAGRFTIRTFAAPEGSPSTTETKPKSSAGVGAKVQGKDTRSEKAEKEDSSDSGSGSESLATSERLLLAIKAGDLDDAEMLAEASVAEAEALAAAVEAAEASSKATTATLDTLKDQYRRLQADFDNFRSRAANEKAQTSVGVKMSVIQDLLPLVDNFELASTQVKFETPGEEKIHNSYQSLYRQMVDVFRGMGLEAVPTEGALFDPEVHDGIMREESDDVPDGTILQEFRKGFKMGDKLLRPAMVKVSYSEQSAAPAGAASAGAAKDGAKEPEAGEDK